MPGLCTHAHASTSTYIHTYIPALTQQPTYLRSSAQAQTANAREVYEAAMQTASCFATRHVAQPHAQPRASR
eukprot:6189128-Pleurochrysis_carterae.AAC.4